MTRCVWDPEEGIVATAEDALAAVPPDNLSFRENQNV